MDTLDSPPCRPASTPQNTAHQQPLASDIDLVGQPLAVLESDPGVFTTLARKLGIRGLEVIELYDIEPWAVDHLAPRGLIFCFLWHKDSHRPSDFADPAAEKVWFANQLIHDACASQALLNVVLNCPNVELGDMLTSFRNETLAMSPVMKGLAIFNSPLIREAHNSLARPSDVRTALHAATKTTMELQKKSERSSNQKPTPKQIQQDQEEAFHFIGYVPAFGKVWELDGLKSGPLEVGELPVRETDPSTNITTNITLTNNWMTVARPALRMKMQKYGGDSIQFSLLALVDDQYRLANDRLEMLRREKEALEKRLSEEFGQGEWRAQMPPLVLEASNNAFTTSIHHDPYLRGRVFADDFGLHAMNNAIRISKLSKSDLLDAWAECVENAERARDAVEEELRKGICIESDEVKRTHDYEPFIKQYITCLQDEGLLSSLLHGYEQEPESQQADKKRKRGKA